MTRSKIVIAVAIAIGIAAVALTLALPAPVSTIKDCGNQCRYIQPDTRSSKERCLDNANNMIQAWRCKYD